MKTCGLIYQKKVNGKTSIYVEKDKRNTVLSQYEVCNDELSMSKISIVIDKKPIRKNMTFVRIGIKSSSSYLRATTQFNLQFLPPLIKMCQLRHHFINSISTDILETIYWSEDESVSDPIICQKLSSNCSKSSSTSPDNPPILQSINPILNSLNINNFNLKHKPFDVIILKILLSEVSCVLTENNIYMNVEKWGGCGKKID